MTHSFPGTPSTSWEVIFIHGLLLVLVLASIASVMWRVRRPARWIDLLIWPVVAAFAVMVMSFGTTLAAPTQQPFLVGYGIFVLVIAAFAMIVTAFRAWRGDNSLSISLVLMTLGILGLTILCLLPATPRARDAALRTICASNLKGIGAAIHNRIDSASDGLQLAGPVTVTREGTPIYGHDNDGNENEKLPPTSWRVVLLPYIEQRSLFDKYDVTRPWDDSRNDPISKTQILQYSCPAAIRYSRNHTQNERGQFFTAYLAITGPGTLFPERQRLRMPTDNAVRANTLMVVEACGEQVIWTEPRDIDVSRNSIDVNKGSAQRDRSPSILSSYHGKGALGVMGDGWVQFINKDIDPQVLRAMMNAAQGESKRE